MAKPSIIRAKGKMYQIPNNSIIRAVTIGEKALIKLDEKKYSMYPSMHANFAHYHIEERINNYLLSQHQLTHANYPEA